MKFAGTLHSVNPKRESVHGVPCVPAVADLAQAPDAAFVGVNKNESVRVAKQLADIGCGGAVFFAAGFAEANDRALQNELVDAAGTMPVLGPNCYGLLNYLDGVPLWPDQHGGKQTDSGVAIISQSSNIANNITMQRRALPLAYVACVGNQAQTGMSDIGAAMLNDPRVTAIGFYIEGVDNPAAFANFAKAAHEKNKPVAVLKIGNTETARTAALSHTASLAGNNAAARAFFRRVGIPMVNTVPELLEALKLFHIHGALPGRNICSVSCSGGEAALMADRKEKRGLRFGELSEPVRANVRAALSDVAPARNPLDYHTFIWGNEPALTKTFAAMTANNFDLSLFVLDFPRTDRCESSEWDAVVRACESASAKNNARIAMVSTLPENLSEERAEDLMKRNIVPLLGFDEALAATEAAACFGETNRLNFTPPLTVATDDASLINAPLITLNEAEAKRRLEEFGVSVPEGIVANTPDAVAQAAKTIGTRVAIKRIGIAHKTEAGAVALNIRPDDAAKVADGMGAGPWLIERMIENGIAEIILGVSRDPAFGLALTIGAGGILAELLKDSATVLLPTSEREIRSALDSLRCAPLLNGFRGKPKADIGAIVSAAVALAKFAEANAGTIEEIDINPLIALEDGAVAADALIHIREQPR